MWRRPLTAGWLFQPEAVAQAKEQEEQQQRADALLHDTQDDEPTPSLITVVGYARHGLLETGFVCLRLHGEAKQGVGEGQGGLEGMTTENQKVSSVRWPDWKRTSK